jgi:hypothetical protein
MFSFIACIAMQFQINLITLVRHDELLLHEVHILVLHVNLLRSTVGAAPTLVCC